MTDTIAGILLDGLHIGVYDHDEINPVAFRGMPFRLPLECATQKISVIGVSGSGKTVLWTVMFEEYFKRGLPCIAFDFTDNGWGLRVGKDGKSEGLRVLVIGGRHGDKGLDVEPANAARYAHALIEANVFAVVDLTSARQRERWLFAKNFMDELRETKPEVPHHMFLEEAKHIAPQTTASRENNDCKTAVDNAITDCRNYGAGIGVTLVTQRPAIVSMTARSQCGSMFVMRMHEESDLDAMMGWVKTNGPKLDAAAFRRDVARLPTGVGFYVNPGSDAPLTRIRVRERETLHPNHAAKFNPALLKRVVMADVGKFAEQLARELTRHIIAAIPPVKDGVPNPSPRTMARVSASAADAGRQAIEKLREDLAKAQSETTRLTYELTSASSQLDACRAQLKMVRDATAGIYAALTPLHIEPIEEGVFARGTASPTDKWQAWLERAPGPVRKCLEVLIAMRKVTRKQLVTLAHISTSGSRVRHHIHWMHAHGLIDKDGDNIILREL